MKARNLSKAMNVIKNFDQKEAMVDLKDAQRIEEIKALHPFEEKFSMKNFDHTFNFSAKDFYSTLKGCNRLSANAFSGWTFELIKEVARCSKEVEKLFLILLNILANGKCLNQVWCASRIIAIKKENSSGGCKLRPIAISDHWYRLASSLVVNDVKWRVRDKLCPLQQCVAVRNGYSNIVHAASLFHNHMSYCDKDLEILLIDISNAFNSILRKSIY